MDRKTVGQIDRSRDRRINSASIFSDIRWFYHARRIELCRDDLLLFQSFEGLWHFVTCLKIFWCSPLQLSQLNFIASRKNHVAAPSWFQKPASTSIYASTRHNGWWVNDFDWFCISKSSTFRLRSFLKISWFHRRNGVLAQPRTGALKLKIRSFRAYSVTKIGDWE